MDVVESGQLEHACGRDCHVEDSDYVNVCHNLGFVVDKVACLCFYHYNHWTEEGVCDGVLRNQSENVVLDCGCNHGDDLDRSVEIFLNYHHRIHEVAQVKENENEMTGNSADFVGGTNDDNDRVMESGPYLSS